MENSQVSVVTSFNIKFAVVTLILGTLTACSGSNGNDVTVTESNQKSELNKELSQRKNILFILVDDLGYADIGAYNTKSFYETPNIDGLANSGVTFTQGYAANPVCSPSRVAIMTGKHPTRIQATEWFHVNNYPHRVEQFRPAENREYLPPEETTLAEIYQANGYKTAFLGKWHLGEDIEQFPQNQGFDVNVAGVGNGHPPGGYFSPYNNPSIKDGPEGEYLTDRLTNEAISLIEGYAGGNEPFLLYLSFYTVHTPLQAPAAEIAKYQTKKDAEIQSTEFAKEQQYFVSESGPRYVRIKQNHTTYAAMIEKMDINIGKLLNTLDKTGIADDTIVVFTSDNGGLSTSEGSPTSNLPLRGGKGWLYEGGVRVPFVIRAPGQQKAGLKTQYQAIGMDFIPTLAAMTSIELPKDLELDGVDLSSVVKGSKMASTERPLFWHYPHYSNQGGFPGAAVRLGDYKLLQNFEDGSLQLYDLSRDTGESTDIKAQQPAKVSELQALLYEWYQETNAKFLRPLEGSNQKKPFSVQSSQ